MPLSQDIANQRLSNNTHKRYVWIISCLLCLLGNQLEYCGCPLSSSVLTWVYIEAFLGLQERPLYSAISFPVSLSRESSWWLQISLEMLERFSGWWLSSASAQISGSYLDLRQCHFKATLHSAAVITGPDGAGSLQRTASYSHMLSRKKHRCFPGSEKRPKSR